MDILLAVFHEAIFRPLLNFLIFILNILPGNDLGFSIIVVTILTRVVFYPLSYKALYSQKKLLDLQPKLKEVQEKHKHDKPKQTQAVMEFYKEHNVNPFTGCLPFLIQIPILLGLYRVFLVQLTPENLEANLYPFISQPEHINFVFLGLINLAFASPVLAVLAGLSQYLYSRVMFSQRKNLAVPIGGSAGADFQKILTKQMMYVLPVITVFIAWRFPAGLALYWLTTTLFSFGQQYIINKKMK